MKVLYAVLIAGALVLIYGALFLWNKKTPVPKGCENLKPDCAGCGIADCAVRGQIQEKITKEIEKNHGNC